MSAITDPPPAGPARSTTAALIRAHADRGRVVEAAGIETFVIEEGQGEPVLCIHGVPASSWLYRKVLPQLAARGMRGIAYDLPGLGLSARPPGYDYTWTGLGRHAVALADALALDRFHLVVHDIGGPVGFELAAALPERVRSLTILNTLIDVASFRRPWTMEPFAWRAVGPAYLAALSKPIFRGIMRFQGIGDLRAVPGAEIDAYVDLLRRGDRGRAFLQIMRGFGRTEAKQALYRGAVGDGRFPRQVIWGARDPALRIETSGEIARTAAGVEEIHRLPGRHFLQEDCAPQIADLIAQLAEHAGTSEPS